MNKNLNGRPLLASLILGLLGLGFAPLVAAQDPPPPSTTEDPAPPPPSTDAGEGTHEGTFNADEIIADAGTFFGSTSKDLATLIEKVFREKGQPVAYITGQEASGAVAVGLRYGEGTLKFHDGSTEKVYWQGPSVGWDIGGNASKVFTLVYNMDNGKQIYRRFPGVDGSLYFLAGFGMNYQQADKIVLAPIRTGVGFRAGASIGYLHYSEEKKWLPL